MPAAKGAGPIDRTAWNTAKAEHKARRATFESAIRACDDAIVGTAEYRECRTAEDRTLQTYTAAMNALIATPAPDLQAVSFKVDLAREFDLSLEGIHADLKRLAGGEAGA